MRPRLRPLLPVLALILLACAPDPAAARSIRLSDEQQLSRWAHPLTLSAIRARPKPASRAVAKLHRYTEDRLPEIYLALQQMTDSRGRTWVRIRVPRRPNGVTGWVRREALGPWHRVTTMLRVDRGRLRVTLYDRGRVVWRSRVGVGKRGTPTPGGRFYIREVIKNLGGDSLYGPIAFGTSAYSRLSDWPGGGVIGIHGTDQPYLLPGRVSHGCVRLPNNQITRLARLLPLGTPVRIV